MAIKGRFYDGRHANSHEALLSINEEGQLHCSPELIPPQPISQVQISRRIGDIPRRLTFADGGMFETVDHETLDDWMQQHGISNGWVHRLESNYRYVIVALVAVAAIISAMSLWGIPWISARIAYRLPADVSRHIGHGVLETLDSRIFKPTTLDWEQRRDLRRRFQVLVAGDTRASGATLVFRRGGIIGANAFALPDGTVVMTDELVGLAEHDGELQSVMLHELGHLVYRHSLRRVISHSGLAILTLAITGDVHSAGTIVVALPGILIDSSYSRAMEAEADDYALVRMQQLHIPTTRFADFLQRLGNYGTGTVADNEAGERPPKDSGPDQSPRPTWASYIASHPPTADRIAKFRAAANRNSEE